MGVKKSIRTAKSRYKLNKIRKTRAVNAIKKFRSSVENEAALDVIEKNYSNSQAILDRLANCRKFHPNKSARLKSRMYKKLLSTKMKAENMSNIQ